MKTLAQILFVFAFIFGVVCDAKSLEFTGDFIVGGNYSIDENVTVASGANLTAHDIRADVSLHIYNQGEIHGGLNICAGCTVELRNGGVFDASVTKGTDARLVQVITSNDEITDIGMTSGFDVAVRNGEGINLGAVVPIFSIADSVEIKDTRFNGGSISDFTAISDAILHGDIVILFDNAPDTPIALFTNITGDGVVHVDTNVTDKLYIAQTYKVDDDIFLRRARSTDYARILNNDMGTFLNKLRASGDDNKLFTKLDNAKTMTDINSILSHSVRTAPIKLMRPISLLYSYKPLESMYIDDGVVIGIEPLMIYSSDVFITGIQPNVAFNLVNDLYIKLSGYVIGIGYSDDINEYDGTSFGLGVVMQYDISNDDFVRAHIGGGKSFFDIGAVFGDGSIVSNPDGTSVYAIGEYGHTFDIGGYEISPFVGFGAEYITIANTDDTTIYGIGGTDIGCTYDFDGLRYNYSTRVMARTDGAFGGGINLSVWSIFDDAGADMHMGTIYNNDFGMSFMLSINGRFKF